MKILVSMPIFEMAGGGAEDFGFRTCLHLAGLGHDVMVVTDRGEAAAGIKVVHPLSSINKALEETRPDLHLDWGFNHPADIHRLGGGAHKVFLRYSLNAYPWYLRWYKLIRNSSPRNMRIIRKQHSLLTRPDARFLANSRFAASQLITSGAREDAVMVLHNGVDTEHFRPNQGDGLSVAMRKGWGIGDNDCVALFVAHNLVLKNFSLVRDVFGRLGKKLPGLRLVVVGKRRPNSMPPCGLYAGEVRQMASCYRAADFLVHPTFFDSCANVVLEAMSTGLPVLVSNVCGADELVEDAVTGYVMPVKGSPRKVLNEWSEKIEMMATDPDLREGMGDRARTAMLRNDLRSYIKRLEGILNETLLRKKTQPSYTPASRINRKATKTSATDRNYAE